MLIVPESVGKNQRGRLCPVPGRKIAEFESKIARSAIQTPRVKTPCDVYCGAVLDASGTRNFHGVIGWNDSLYGVTPSGRSARFQLSAHQLAWRIANDMQPIEDGAWVLHLCDLGICVNVSHLELVEKDPAAVNNWHRRLRGAQWPEAFQARDEVRAAFNRGAILPIIEVTSVPAPGSMVYTHPRVMLPRGPFPTERV